MSGQKILFCIFVFIHAKTFSQEPKTKILQTSPSLPAKNKYYRVITSDFNAFTAWAKRKFPDSKVEIHPSRKFVTVENVPLIELQKNPKVKTIDRANRIPKEETVLGDFDFTLNGVTGVHALYPLASGDGLTLSVKEKPFDSADVDLRGRVVMNSQFDNPFTAHATFMATIAAGAGNSSPLAKGAAWKSTLTTSDFTNLMPDNESDLIGLGVSVQNHSYGVGVENYYGIESSAYDEFCVNAPKILHVFSSGNDGDKALTSGAYANLAGIANITGQFKVSKNTISVGSSDQYGNVVPLSSRGPAHDGRIKPELIAFGPSGSSEAAAIVSGISLILQKAFKNKFADLPDAALVKAVLINSAKDTGRPNVDFETGFGNADALGALRIIENEHFFKGSVSQNEKMTFPIYVPANTKSLKITVVWNDRPAEPLVTKALINDLDMTLHRVGNGEIWKPWILSTVPPITNLEANAQRGSDHLNNVEQITLKNPIEGNYEIDITGFDVPEGVQSFFIAYEFLSGVEWMFPLQGNAMASNSKSIIRWTWNDDPGFASLEYKFVNESDWRTINTSVDLSKSYFEWKVPDTTGLVQLRFSFANQQVESVVFPVSNPSRVKVGYNCEEQVMLYWQVVPGATGYVLYNLGQKYLEPYLTVQDTFAIVDKSKMRSSYFVAAPLFGTHEGQRELTVNYILQGTGCYFINFSPNQYLVDSDAAFKVSLGTTYNLEKATLERSESGVYKPVQTITSFNNTNFMMVDPLPLSGFQHYRVSLSTNFATSILSDTVEVFVIHPEEVFVYPNPVAVGQMINIVVSNEEVVSAQFINALGQQVQAAEDTGPIKSFDTAGLMKGIYLIRIQKSDGTIWIRKIVVY
jgi:hypothetical protein